MKKRKIVLSFFFLASILVVGTFFYSYLEGWSFLDSLYFVVITITTIGYGDVVPITEAGKILTIVLSIFGVSMAFYFLGLIGTSLFKKHVEAKVSEIKEGVKKQEEIKGEIKKVLKDNLKKPANKKK